MLSLQHCQQNNQTHRKHGPHSNSRPCLLPLLPTSSYPTCSASTNYHTIAVSLTHNFIITQVNSINKMDISSSLFAINLTPLQLIEFSKPSPGSCEKANSTYLKKKEKKSLYLEGVAWCTCCVIVHLLVPSAHHPLICKYL